jgi:hypothetical protein
MQLEEQVGFGFKSVIRAIVDNSRQLTGGLEYRVKVLSLRRHGCGTREYPWYHHQSSCPTVFCMFNQLDGTGGILRAGSDNNRNSGCDQRINAFFSLGFAEQWPVAHRSAIDDRPHADIDQLPALGRQGIDPQKTA